MALYYTTSLLHLHSHVGPPTGYGPGEWVYHKLLISDALMNVCGKQTHT